MDVCEMTVKRTSVTGLHDRHSLECNPVTPVECVSLSFRTHLCVLAFITYILCTKWIEMTLVYTPFTQGLRPLCLPCATTKLARSPMKAEGRQNGCLGRSRVVHRTFRHRHGRHGRREVLSMFKTVAQRSPRRSVAHRSLKGGRMKAHTSPWSQNGCTVVVHWSSS